MHYSEESKETFPSERIDVVAVHLGMFYRAAKNVPVELGRKITFYSNNGTYYSALVLPYYGEESNEMLHSKRIHIVIVHLG